jgi:branched-chain amino acid transport system substrate-binding protein
MGDGGSRFDLPKATRFPLQGEGQDGSEEREFLRRLGGFDLPPPNGSPQFRSGFRGLKYWLLAAPAILAIVVSIGIYTLVPALKDGNFKLAALLTESSSVTPLRRDDNVQPSPSKWSDQAAQMRLAPRAVPSPDASALAAAASPGRTATSPDSRDVASAASVAAANADAPSPAQTLRAVPSPEASALAAAASPGRTATSPDSRDVASAASVAALHADAPSPAQTVPSPEASALAAAASPGRTATSPDSRDVASAAPVAAANAAAPSPAKTRAPEIAVHGVSDKEILFGMAAPFGGASRELGRQMKIGLETAFSQINDAGGANGRLLRLVTADDGYEPTRTADVMKSLYDKDQVFGFIGNVGTPTAAVALPFALDHRALFFGAFTGAGLLRRDPPDRYVFNYRASYAEETSAVVHYLVKVRRIQPKEIVVFAQQDSYGDSGYAGVQKAVRSLPGDNPDIVRLNYKRNTVDVQDAVDTLRAYKGQIKAVVMVASYRAAAKFIEKTRDLYPSMVYTNVSFVGSTALADELMLLGPRYAAGTIVTQVVPAINSSATIVLKYKEALAKYFPGESPDYVSFEGYIDGNILAEAVKRVGRDINTEKLIDELEQIHAVDLGLGAPVTFSSNEHQGSHKVWGTQLDQAGHYQPIDLE